MNEFIALQFWVWLENRKKVFSLNNNFEMCLQHLLDFVELSFTIYSNKRISEIFYAIHLAKIFQISTTVWKLLFSTQSTISRFIFKIFNALGFKIISWMRIQKCISPNLPKQLLQNPKVRYAIISWNFFLRSIFLKFPSTSPDPSIEW